MLNTQFREHFVGGFFHYFGAGVKVFIHSVTKTHKPEWVILVFSASDKLFNPGDIADFF